MAAYPSYALTISIAAYPSRALRLPDVTLQCPGPEGRGRCVDPCRAAHLAITAPTSHQKVVPKAPRHQAICMNRIVIGNVVALFATT